MSDAVSSLNSSAIQQATEAATTAKESGQVLESIFYTFVASVLGQDDVLQGYLDEMTAQTRTLTDINDLLQSISSIKSNLQQGKAAYDGLSITQAELTQKLESLAAAGVTGLAASFPNATASDIITQLESLQSSLSTAQSSQGALNEDLSLRMNQAASSRAAMLTQLQTLLQTIMQSRQQLARF